VDINLVKTVPFDELFELVANKLCSGKACSYIKHCDSEKELFCRELLEKAYKMLTEE